MTVQSFYSNHYLETPASVVILDYLHVHTVYAKLLEISVIYVKGRSVGLLTQMNSIERYDDS